MRLISKDWRRLYWLDVHRLADNLLQPGQRLLGVHYFTTRIRSRPGDEDTRRRQGTYLEALKTLPGVRLHYGHYPGRCVDAGTPTGDKSRKQPGMRGILGRL